MALVSIGSAGTIVKQAANAIGSNAITNALGIDFGTILTPNKFLTKFSPSTVFAYRSLAYEIRNAKNFDVIFHWFPRCSQIRTMFSNAFSASDTDEINLLVRSIQMPNILNEAKFGNNDNPHFGSALAGNGLKGSNSLNMKFLNTEFSYLAHCFYQWISETESPYWVYGPSVMIKKDKDGNMALGSMKTAAKYMTTSSSGDASGVISDIESGSLHNMVYLMSDSQCCPFTRADIEIKYYSSNMKELHSVWFMGAFPTSIQLESLDNNPSTIEDQGVQFTYDSICVSSPFNFDGAKKGNVTSSTLNAFNKATGDFGISSNSSNWTAGLYDDSLTQIVNTYLDKLSKKLNKITNKAGEKLSNALASVQNKLTA